MSAIDTEKTGISHLQIGMRVEDDDYGIGEIKDINPKPEYDNGEFKGGELVLELEADKSIISVASSCVKVIN